MSLSMVGSWGAARTQEFHSTSGPSRFQTGRGVVEGLSTLPPQSEAPTEIASEESSSSSSARRSQFTPEQGREMAQAMLAQRGSLAQASFQFEQVRGPENVNLTETGRRRATLQAMTRMGETLYQQHSGGRQGESYDKVQLGEMLQALKGQNGPSNSQYFPVPKGNAAFRVLADTLPAEAPKALESVA